MGLVPSTSDMDITLIISLMRNLQCLGFNKSFDWSRQPASTDLTIEADMCRLKRYRNNISHISTTTGINQNDFVHWWNDIEQLLFRQSSPALNIQKTIDDLKTCPLDPEEERRIEKELKKWKDYESYFDRLKEEIKEVKGDVGDLRKSVVDLTEKMDERKDSSDLKTDLIQFYRWRHSKVQLSPLFEEKDTPLAAFYVRPDISQIKSLSDILKTGLKSHQEIYLTADAGLGKTVFSKYLAMSWCQAHRPITRRRTSFEKDDTDCLHQFEFLFLILLRESSYLCSIDDLIFELIVSDLAHSKKFDTAFLEEILNREKCLVILDGLDEWTHPEITGKPCNRTSKLIPHRNCREMCTVLTTTRPWKLGILNLSSNELGKQLELTKLSKNSTVTLTRRALRRLKSIPEHNENVLKREVNKFMKEIKGNHNDELIQVPLLLMYMICLWCDGGEIGYSKCELYVNIVELLLARTTAKHGKIQTSSKPLDCMLEDCFKGHDHCTKCYMLLVALGKLAYHTLFNENRGNTLVFEGSVIQKYLTDEEKKLSLLSGILTESTTKTLTKQSSKVSFSHKTVQEFFAAIFICSRGDPQEKVIKKCQTVQDILDMSTVCQFISGMNATKMLGISKGFMSVIYDEVNRTRTSPQDIHKNQLYYIQKMLVSCLKEIPESKNIKLCIQDVFISSHNAHDLKSLSKLNKNTIMSLYIDINNISRSFREIIELSTLSELNYVQNVTYVGDEREAEISRLLSPCLQKIYVGRGQWINYEENLTERLELIQNLQYLYICASTFAHEVLELFLDFISSKKSLKEVTLLQLCCNEHGCFCERLQVDLSQHSHLTKVELVALPPLQINISSPSLVDVRLDGIDLGENSLSLSPDMLNVKRILLSHIVMSAESFKNNMKILESLPHSVTVEIVECRIEPILERHRVRSFILKSENLPVTREHYELSNWSFEIKTRKLSKK